MHAIEPPMGQIAIPEEPEITLMLVRCAKSNITSWAMGNRATKQQSTLNWNQLIKVFGSEEALNARIASLKSLPEEPIVELANRYASGWRPKDIDS